jgi:3-methyladenine DNA glycosylase AlkD
MTYIEVIQMLSEKANSERAKDLAKHHKVLRPYYGVSNAELNEVSAELRALNSDDYGVDLAAKLWTTNVFEARMLAAKLVTRAIIRPDTAAWDLITSWLSDLDCEAIADQVCKAGQKRVSMDPTRLNEIEAWTTSDHVWTQRAALMMTLPWTKQNNPKPAEIEARERILGWAAIYASDPLWLIQKSVGVWLFELSKHDAPRAHTFLEEHGDAMRPSVRKEAARNLPSVDA